MHEFLKLICVLVILAAMFVTGFAWIDPQPNGLTWALRVGTPIAAIIAFALFLRVHFRRDEVPEYLHGLFGGSFDRGGFCFTFVASLTDGVCFLDMFFQNKYERPCVGRVALRPAEGFFGRRKIDAITYEVQCDAAAFGVARIPVSVPAAAQGKRQKFEVGASVDYPEGKGRMLRFRDGAVIRTNSKFGNKFHTALTVAGALTCTLVLSTPATVTIQLPVGVAEEIPESMKPETRTLWRLGDTPKTFSSIVGAYGETT